MFDLRNFTIEIYKKRMSNYHLPFLLIFFDLDIMKFCKLYNLFCAFPKVWAIFNLCVFRKQ